MSLSPINSALPQDCIVQIFLFSGSTPICARVCKCWDAAAQRSYEYILDAYAHDEKTKPFVPLPSGTAREAVEQTYRKVMASTYDTHRQAKAEVLELGLPMRLALHPVLKMAEHASLVQFFEVVDHQLPRNDESLTLEGNLAHQSLSIQNWMEAHPPLLDGIVDICMNSVDNLRKDFKKFITLPPQIGKLRNVQELDFGGNDLIALPKELGQLTRLWSLNFYGNHINTVPPEIFQLTSLRRLNFDGNQIANLPTGLSQLTDLTFLDLSSNKVKTLPPEILQLPSLKHLSLSHNQIADLHTGLSQLTNLWSLNFCNNQVKTLPPEIFQLTGLRNLFLSGNPLAALPIEFSKLTNLWNLDLPHISLRLVEPIRIEVITNLSALHEIIGALDKNTQKALEMFKELPSEIKNAIYGELYIIPDFKESLKDTYWRCAEEAFLQLDGQDTSNELRIEAIENFMQKRAGM